MPDDAKRFLVVRNKVHERHQQDCHWPTEIEHLHQVRITQNLVWLQDVRFDRHDAWTARQDVAAERDGNRIDVDIHHARRRVQRLRNLVHVASRRDARTQVQELAYSRRHGKHHRSTEKSAIRPQEACKIRLDGKDLFRGFAVDREVVVAAQEIVIHAGVARSRFGMRRGLHDNPLLYTTGDSVVAHGAAVGGPTEHQRPDGAQMAYATTFQFWV